VSEDGTERPSRCSDPITERGGLVGRGAVLYDTRDPHARPCCARSEGRCLAHVLGVFEETTTGAVYYKVADGTWTTEEWVHADDLLAIFEPAGWSVTGVKPTYLLTREHGVADHHDVMTDGGTVEDDTERPDPGDGPFACSICGCYIGQYSGDYCDGCAREVGAKPPLRRCTECGQRVPEEQMKVIDVSLPNEYYPTFEYLCPGCSTDTGTDSNGGDS